MKVKDLLIYLINENPELDVMLLPRNDFKFYDINVTASAVGDMIYPDESYTVSQETITKYLKVYKEVYKEAPNFKIAHARRILVITEKKS